jgi:hypothetical protein
MMERAALLLLRAFQQGRPLPKGETLHLAICDDPDVLVVAFVRMGGESRPWGIAFGRPDQQATILTVPEGRDRDLVADMCAGFAPVLLEHFRTPRYVLEEPAQWEDLAPLRQLWLPNGSHLDMLHHLAYAYARTPWGGGARGRLNAFGRLCGWLFREAQRAGQQHVMVATEALRESFTFPAQDTRQGHLGFLLAWLDTRGGRDTRLKVALEAERLPVSTNLDPFLERDTAEPLLEDWHRAERDHDAKKQEGARAGLSAILEAELARRYDLAVEAITRLRSDRRRLNTGVEVLVREGLKEQWYQHTRMELGLGADEDGPAFTASPETDRYPPAAGSRYQVYLASDEFRQAVLLHDDTEMQSEAIAGGDAFRGIIEYVEDVDPGAKTVPIWIIRDQEPGVLRLREGSWVCVLGLPNRTGRINSIRDQEDGSRLFEVEITGWKTKPKSMPWVPAAADSAALEGTEVTFVAHSADQISRRKSQLIWDADVPGAWLTHARPQGPRARSVPEAEEEAPATAMGVS